jgi:uracil-DNA glycosylase
VTGDLEALRSEIAACRICVERPKGRPLPHEPRPVLVPSATARILVAGQAPGTRVHASGRPFTDPSGDRLREWLGIGMEAFYDPDRLAIVPMGFCFPGLDAKGSDLPPRRECAPAWRSRLMALMPQLELVVAIGRYAQDWHLPPRADASVTATVSGWRRIWEASAAPRAIPLPHPSWRNSAWLKRNPWFESELLPLLRAEVERLMTK